MTDLRTPDTTARPAATVAAPRDLAVLAWAGIAGPVVTAVLFIGQDLLRDGVDPVAEPVSALSAGPGGWVQQLSFVLLGVLTMAHAVGLHLGMRPSRGGAAAPALLFVVGVAAVLAAAFPITRAADGTLNPPSVGHGVAGTVFFLGTPVALLLLARRMRHDERWRSLARPLTVGAGSLLVAALVVRVLTLPDVGPLEEYFGLVQRLLVLGLLYPLRIVVAARLLAVARGRRADRRPA